MVQVITELPDAQARLNELVGLVAASPQIDALRATLDGAKRVLLSAGVLAHEDLFMWYTLRGNRDPKNVERVSFELDLASDTELPPSILLTCLVGRAQFSIAAGRDVQVKWSANASEILNKKNGRVGKVVLRLDDKSNT